MIKKTMTYTDFNGVERTEDFYFNLTKAELIEMESTKDGSFAETLKKIVAAKDQYALIRIFKDFILKAYGVKSPDGRRFMKSKELSDEFAQTPAYSDLYMLLATNDEEAAKFINGIIPQDLAKDHLPASNAN